MGTPRRQGFNGTHLFLRPTVYLFTAAKNQFVPGEQAHIERPKIPLGSGSIEPRPVIGYQDAIKAHVSTMYVRERAFVDQRFDVQLMTVPLTFNCPHHTISSLHISLNLSGQSATIRRQPNVIVTGTGGKERGGGGGRGRLVDTRKTCKFATSQPPSLKMVPLCMMS